MVKRLVLAAVLAAAPAHAGNTKLADARAALDAVHYPDAQRLLGEALDVGGSSPAEVAEIYRLSASTAAALGHADVAEQFYRRWLAIDPHASLAAGDSPKLRVPFEAARAFIHANGGLVVRVHRTEAGIDVAIVSDPIVMAVAAANGGDPPEAFRADRHVRLADGPGPVAILDDRGNHLVEVDAPAAPPPPAPVTPDEPTSNTWKYFAGAAGVFTATAIGLGVTALSYNAKITDAVAHSGDHFASDIDHERDRARLFAYMSAGAMAAGLLFALPAIHYYPNSLRTLVFGSGVGVAGSF